MKWDVWAKAVLVLGLVLGVPGQLAAQAIWLKEGKSIFMRTCHRCHPLVEGESGKIAPRIGHMDVFQFATAIWNQSVNMFRAFEVEGWQPPILSKTQMIQVFLFTQIVTDRPVPGDPEQGRRFVQRNHCLTCHSIGGSGGSRGLPWDDYANTLHPTLLMSAVWRHRRHMLDAFRELGLPLPQFQRGDLANLMAFIRQVGRPRVYAPQMVDISQIGLRPDLFDRFDCHRCHRPRDFVGQPERKIPEITEALLAHAFMPAFERPPLSQLALSPEDSLSLVILIYLYSHMEEPGDPRQGRVIFQQQFCTNCHDYPEAPSPESEKKIIGPIVDEWDLMTHLFNKVPLMLRKAQVESRAFPRLTPEEMRHLYAYLCSASEACTLGSTQLIVVEQ